ncbi:MAG TPA: NlpC/P60 family protein [Actinomycetota bacterium]|jgi:cell wall-associated NlpC family hydrolase
MTGRGRRIERLVAAAVFVLLIAVSFVPASFAAPSKSQVEAAKAKLAELRQRTDLLVEQYNQAKLALDQTRQRLADLRQTKADADAEAAKAMADLERRAVSAYTGMGSELDAILGATTFADFSDRIQYVGALAETDEDLAATADAAGERARWAAAEVAKALADQKSQQEALQAKIGEIKQAAADQLATYSRLNDSYQTALAAERAAEQAAQAALDGGGSSGGGSYTGPPPPPPNTSVANTAIYYAKSVIGTPYVWGSADPSVGFDCSGLVMWAYGKAGVSLPHSSAAQYGVTAHVAREDLQPGDLLFFYTPISHVAIYLGGNMMIDASHPGPGGGVDERTIYWDNFVAGGRPT